MFQQLNGASHDVTIYFDDMKAMVAFADKINDAVLSEIAKSLLFSKESLANVFARVKEVVNG